MQNETTRGSASEINDSNGGESENDDENSNDENGECIPDVVKVYLFLSKEVKNAITIAEKLNVHSTQRSASAQLKNLKIIWNEFRVTHRTISVSENKQFSLNMNELQLRYLKVIGKMNEASCAVQIGVLSRICSIKLYIPINLYPMQSKYNI